MGTGNPLLCATERPMAYPIARWPTRSLEGLADRELEDLGLVTPLRDAVAMLGIERHTEAEPEQSQRGQPLHSHADRAADVAPFGEVVALGRDAIRAVELNLAAGLVNATHVEEGAHA